MKISRLFILCFGAALLLAACAEKPVATDNSVLLEMKTGPCFGYCPVYNLVIRNNGAVEYEGVRFAELIGKKTVQLTDKEYAQLKKRVQEANLWQYPETIQSQIADAPYVTMTVHRGEEAKTVRGSIDRPQPLLDLEALVVKTVEGHGINLTKGVQPPRDR